MTELKIVASSPIPLAKAPARAANPGAAAASAITTDMATAPVSDKTMMSVPVEHAVSRLNAYAQSTQRDLNFTLDDDTGKTVVRVLDRGTGELIRQIPTEVAIHLAETLDTEPLSLIKTHI